MRQDSELQRIADEAFDDMGELIALRNAWLEDIEAVKATKELLRAVQDDFNRCKDAEVRSRDAFFAAARRSA